MENCLYKMNDFNINNYTQNIPIYEYKNNSTIIRKEVAFKDYNGTLNYTQLDNYIRNNYLEVKELYRDGYLSKNIMDYVDSIFPELHIARNNVPHFTNEDADKSLEMSFIRLMDTEDEEHDVEKENAKNILAPALAEEFDKDEEFDKNNLTVKKSYLGTALFKERYKKYINIFNAYNANLAFKRYNVEENRIGTYQKPKEFKGLNKGLLINKHDIISDKYKNINYHDIQDPYQKHNKIEMLDKYIRDNRDNILFHRIALTDELLQRVREKFPDLLVNNQ